MSRKKNKAEIFRDRETNEVVVLDAAGGEIFLRPYSRQTVSIAHTIYMNEKYGEVKNI